MSAAATPPDDGDGTFADVTSPAGLIVELVSSAAQPRFATWFAGGSLGSRPLTTVRAITRSERVMARTV